MTKKSIQKIVAKK